VKDYSSLENLLKVNEKKKSSNILLKKLKRINLIIAIIDTIYNDFVSLQLKNK